MGGGIYLIQDNDQLVEMTEQAYDSEDQLQEFLETYPNLLAGDDIDRGIPRRWLLISREIVTSKEEEMTQEWALSHLFLDQEAIPTLVEVKPTHNREVRQKVVGEMIDYAANAGIYWPLESIIAKFEVNCRENGRDPEQVFEEFLGEDANEEKFWQKVKTNLQAGKIRLVFVAENISAELRRIVEFLNEQMDPVEILALEIKQYVSQEGLRTLVPRVIGQTTEAQLKKSSTTRERRKWDETSFFSEFKTRWGNDEASIVIKIHNWAKNQEPLVKIQWGTGDVYGGFAAIVNQQGRKNLELFSIDISGRLEIYSNNYSSQPPFNSNGKWLELRSKLSSIGLALPENSEEFRAPSLRLSTLQDDEALDQVMESFHWVIEEVNQG
ncbi:MAG: hypothetical protein F6K40_25365 [Okeania sp. SIO3I5]|uniref:hypothetical protein n=1 Tax=Okeania sp. SIO3I5 TaxID=2607805 RepID=UPI0013BAF781|nr:hypothetical protein [Okeania sp. SIO3I5]NEQ39402.1 hypothetical protein [Okeania sp. SIO3I5]